MILVGDYSGMKWQLIIGLIFILVGVVGAFFNVVWGPPDVFLGIFFVGLVITVAGLADIYLSGRK